MSFEKRFPSLSKINQPFDSGMYSMSSIDETCLDKVRVKNSLIGSRKTDEENPKHGWVKVDKKKWDELQL